MLPHVLLIFIAASDAGTPMTEALQRALTEALGSGARVTFRSSPSPPTDDVLVERARTDRATATVRLVWDDVEGNRAALRVYVARTDENHDQRVNFQPSDPAEERGRALGFVIASYLLPAAVRPAPPPVIAARAPPPEITRWAVEGFGTAALALEGVGSGWGGGFGVRFWAGERWGVRAGLRLRTGSVLAAQASALSAGASAGLFMVLAANDNPHRLALVGRFEGMLIYDSLTRLAPGSAAMTQSRLLPAAVAMLELEWRLATVVAIHVGAGIEQALGKTTVSVGMEERGQIGHLRGVLEVGFRTRF